MNCATLFKATEIGRICRDWDVVSLADIRAKKKFAIVDGPFGTQLHSSEYVASGVPVVRVTNLSFDGRFLPEDLVYITDDKFGELNRSAIYPGDILVAKTGATIGKLALFPDNYSRGLVASSCLKLTVDKETADTRYVFYFLMSAKGQAQITNLAYGSTRDTINLAPFSEIRLPLPPLLEQRAIARILGTLDDKIELNRRMNQTLEAMAQALFKSWFVDFGPFRDQGMQDSPVGEIPTGWSVGELGQIAKIEMGQSPPGDTYNATGDGTPFYQGIKDFGFRLPRRRVYCTRPSRFAAAYDVLLSVRAPVGTFNVAAERCAIGRGVAALRSNEDHQSYLYYLLDSTKSYWEAFAYEGTVFGCLTRASIAGLRVVIPPSSVAARFQSLAGTMDHLIANAEQECRTLATIRDTLLPKLLSGEIRTKDAERFMGETV